MSLSNPSSDQHMVVDAWLTAFSAVDDHEDEHVAVSHGEHMDRSCSQRTMRDGHGWPVGKLHGEEHGAIVYSRQDVQDRA